MEQHDVERIARATLKELGLATADVVIAPIEGQPGLWRIDIRGNAGGPGTIKIKCGRGSTPQWVREQIFTQYTSS